jgi:hypothetical protein
VVVNVELQLGVEPIAGRLQPAGHSAEPFRGWLQLVAALDALRRPGDSGWQSQGGQTAEGDGEPVRLLVHDPAGNPTTSL